MNRPRFAIVALAAGTALLLGSGASHAVSTSSTVLSDLRISLIDLDTADGITPFVTLDAGSASNAEVAALAPGVDEHWRNQGNGPFGPTSAAGELLGTGGSASISGDPLGAGATFSTSAVAWLEDFSGSGLAATGGLLTLSPHTEVGFTGHAAVTWQASEPQAAAYGEVDLHLTTDLLSGPSLRQLDYFTAGYYAAAPSDSLAGFAEGDLWVAYANASDDPVVLGYSIFLETNANAVGVPPVPPPVPEPSGASLALAGLLAAGLSTWRRRGPRARLGDREYGTESCLVSCPAIRIADPTGMGSDLAFEVQRQDLTPSFQPFYRHLGFEIVDRHIKEVRGVGIEYAAMLRRSRLTGRRLPMTSLPASSDFVCEFLNRHTSAIWPTRRRDSWLRCHPRAQSVRTRRQSALPRSSRWNDRAATRSPAARG